MKLLAALVVASVICIHACAAQDRSRFSFPGQGSKEDWNRAAIMTDQAGHLYQQHRYDEAIKLMESAIRLYPYQADMYANLALAYENGKRDFPKARLLMSKAILMEPRNFDLRIGLVGLECDQGNLTSAKQAFAKASKLARSADDRDRLRKAATEIAELEKKNANIPNDKPGK